jgi:hypothetical protein
LLLFMGQPFLTKQPVKCSHFCNALKLDPLTVPIDISRACQRLRRLASLVWGRERDCSFGGMKAAGGEGIGQGPGRKLGPCCFHEQHCSLAHALASIAKNTVTKPGLGGRNQENEKL